MIWLISYGASETVPDMDSDNILEINGMEYNLNSASPMGFGRAYNLQKKTTAE